MKKFLSIMLLVALVATLCSFVACQPTASASTVMNVSLNPEVEFVVDANGKVVTVNALNEEGNLIISASEFENVEGKTAEEAVELFIQVSAETGFLIKGKVNDGENEIDISISGTPADAEKLYNDVKAKATAYLEELDIQGKINQAKALTEEYLQQLVAECAPYVEEAQLKAMEYQQLVDTLIASRKETAEIYSQELKNAYYEAKAFALEQAKLETLKSHLNALQQVVFDSVNSAYTSAIELIETIRYEQLVSEDSLYQRALANLRQKKIEYLQFRNEVAQMEQTEVTTDVLARLDRLTQALAEAQTALENAGVSANEALDGAKENLTSLYNSVMDSLKSVNINEHLDEISQNQTDALNKFFNDFEAKYGADKQSAKEDWNEMEQDLKTPETSAQ